VDPRLFLADLEAVPDSMAGLAESLAAGNPWAATPVRPDSHLVLVGMGSSAYAAGVAAARLRALGVSAVAELASSDLLPALTERSVVVAISASGESTETVDAVRRLAGGAAPVVGLVNAPGSTLEATSDAVIRMGAGAEQGGVACRTFRHTLALLLALEEHLTGGRRGRGRTRVADVLAAARQASADLLDRRDDWLAPVTGLLDGRTMTAVAAPAHRLASAQQGALMLREGPRRAAVGSEVGEWSHVDVYLTKTHDYGIVLLPGSRWQDELLRWATQRGSAVVSVGADLPAAALSVRYRDDEQDDVRLLTEVLVPELVAARLWAART
jgi:glucosamine 6-phosphate synthetase-like amidotransferase/phosphosugar isomerase protein